MALHNISYLEAISGVSLAFHIYVYIHVYIGFPGDSVQRIHLPMQDTGVEFDAWVRKIP